MSTTARKARKRAGIPIEAKPVKIPTPPLDRAHTWLSRDHYDEKKRRYVHEIRPSQIARKRYGVNDLGWQPPAKYLTGRGKLTKAAQA